MDSETLKKEIDLIDEEYSSRFISLDPYGYFLIKVNHRDNELIAEQYSNNIDEDGLATDPSTGQPLNCDGGNKRLPTKIYKGRSAKELGIKLTENLNQSPISRLDHAFYLGRELQKAQTCLIEGRTYIQD